MDNAYALIMAGGSGTRLWPLSRKQRPKPALKLVENERSMFQIAVERLDPLFPPERIFVVANAQLSDLLSQQTPQIPRENFIIEPAGRDTAPAVALGAVHIRHRDPDAVMAVLTADHHIVDTAQFRAVLAAACERAAQGSIVTLGITPDHPSTGFGYIERGEKVHEAGEIDFYQLVRFAEKPDQETADRFIASGNYSWNSGMFIWPVRRVMAEFALHAPDLSATIEHIAGAIGAPPYKTRLNEGWPSIQKISVDYALMEHINEDVYVVPIQIGWADIGNFGALYDILVEEPGQNVTLGSSPLIVDTNGSLIYSNRLVATLGLDDLVIVDTDDVLLVCHRDRAQDVKQLVEEVKRLKQDTYL